MEKYKLIPFILIAWLVPLRVQAQPRISASGNSDAVISGSGYRISGSLGQSAMGETAASPFRHMVGFWYLRVSPALYAAGNAFVQAPTAYKLFQNYPNPFNPSSVIAYDLPETSEVTIAVYDVRGNLTETLFHGVNLPGVHKAVFQPGRVASGMYLFRLSAKSIDTGKTFYDVKKATFVK